MIEADDTNARTAESVLAAGTNGKCVIEVRLTAPDDVGTANDAARGMHTITIDGGYDGADDEKDHVAEVEVQVSGRPRVIETDAP